ncbi:SH3 domain-containing protein [Roseomonas sp. CCTCC AB2023176]|uniref:SH3 domain-containing protein n=1 Tax=Roseomonas sp. CCTCC AB2023176 TaxID=3342640 RepID=UPI0035D98FD6
MPPSTAACVLLSLTLVALLGGCWEKEARRAPAAADDAARVRVAAEDRLRALRPGAGARFRGVQVYRQAVPDAFAVCGQTNLSDGPTFTLFVAVVAPGAEVDAYLGRTGTEAARVYAETVTRCFDGGGPVPRPGGGPAVAPPIPPLPTGMPDPNPGREPLAASPPRADAPAPSVPAAQAAARAGGTLVVRSNANLRSSPVAGSSVVRVARPGETFTILGEAPGGWYQVGNGAAEAWVHGSLVAVQ